MLFLIAIVLGICLWMVNNNLKAEQKRRIDAEARAWRIMQDNLEFMKEFQLTAKASEKPLLKRMLAEYRSRHGLPDEPNGEQTADRHAALVNVPLPPPGMTATSSSQKQAQAHQARPPRQEIDNESLLLYFGAFLFVAAAGLFVWLGKAPGSVKCLVVVLVTAILYAGGIWLYRQRSKLRQAAQAFVGIGIVLAPLTGVALYSYVLNQSHGYLVWAVTSVACLGLYLHAFRIFRSALMGYVLIFTMLSLFESGIGVASLPVYGFGWGLALLAIAMQAVTYLRKWQPELEAPSAQSAELFVPLAVLAAVAMAPNLGMPQLGCSLLLAAAYYGIGFLSSHGEARRMNALAAQVAATIALPLLIYGLSNDIRTGLLAAIFVVLAQLACLLAQSNVQGSLWRQFGSVLMIATVAAAVIAVDYPAIMLAGTAASIAVGAVIWLRQHRAEAYALAGLALTAAPFIYGQLLRADISAQGQTLLSLGTLLVLLVIQLLAHGKARGVAHWTFASTLSFGVAVAAVMLSSVLATPYFCLAIAVVVSAALITLAEQDKRYDWAEAVAVVLAVPILRSFDDGPAALVSVLVSLAFLSALTLRYRSVLLRWTSTFVWLLLPVTVGQSDTVGDWSAVAYAWSYMAVMVVLIGLRAMAQGIVLRSDKVRIVSLMRGASLSYVFGYVAAAVIAVLVSLASDSSRLHTSLILAVIIGVAWFAGRRIERRPEAVALQPLLVQALLLSAVRPETGTATMLAYLVTSTLVAVAFYMLASELETDARLAVSRPISLAALLSGLVTPLAVMATSGVWPMAVGLMAFGAMLLDYCRHRTQADREWSLAVVALGALWLLGILGVHEVQAYTHTAVAFLAGLAYWRFRRGERQQSDQYLWATLITATIPLALEALASTTNGGLYGWWLLLEQVVIMLLGMSIKRSFVTRWGLYVAVGAVLYQLRGLGYAALAVLAVFLIGLAVYRLQKSDKKYYGP